MNSASASSGTDEESESRINHLTQIYPTHLENLSDRNKVAVLSRVFPGINPIEIKQALNKCKGNAALAIDEILNRVFHEDSGLRYQVVKAATESEPRPHTGNGNGRKFSVLVAERPRQVHNMTRRSRGPCRRNSGADRSRRPPFMYGNGKYVPGDGLKKVSVDPSDIEHESSVKERPKVPDEPANGKRKDRGRIRRRMKPRSSARGWSKDNAKGKSGKSSLKK